MKYRVLRITNNMEEYPRCEKDTTEFPELVRYVEDEMDMFVMDENGAFCNADEFFMTHNILEFEAI